MQHIADLISLYGPFILLPLMIVEGPIITIIASFLASLGVLNIFVVYILALSGNIIGDLMYYSIGRFGRERFIKKYGHYLGLYEDRIKKLEQHYKDHFYKTILIAKITEAPIVPTLVAAGLAKTNIRKYVLLTSMVEIPKVMIVVVIGYYFGKFYKTIDHYFQNAVLGIGLSMGGAILVFLLITAIRKRTL